MTQLEKPNSQLRYLMVRFCIVTLLTIIAVTVINIILAALMSLDASSGSALVTAMVPALDSGQTFARRYNRQPGKGEAWRIAAIFAVLSTLISFSIRFLLSLFGDDRVGNMVSDIGALVFAVIILGAMLIYLLIIRFFFGFGAKTELKRAAKLLEKEQ